MTTTAELMRAWRGPAIFTYGFRPFFFGAGVWAALTMAIWVAVISGAMTLPSAFDPVAWHAHEVMFGYLGAVIAGFLLTAVPNWTGRLPIVGWPLAGLAALWLAGRVAVAFSASLSPLLVAVIDLSGLAALAGFLAREIIAGRNWRNLIVLAMLSALVVANGLFHWEAARGGSPAQGIGFRLALSAGILLLSVIGGRIIPSFTRNWLVKRGNPARPAAPDRFDQITIGTTLAALVAWTLAPVSMVAGLALLICAALQFWRLNRWSWRHTGAEPLVWILHLGYAFVPLGALAMGLAILFPAQMAGIGAQHLWMAGALGTMTIAVMTRATLGHTGQALTANRGTVAIYLAIVAAVVCRFVAGFDLALSSVLLDIAGTLWCAGFLGFAVVYGRLLLRPKSQK